MTAMVNWSITRSIIGQLPKQGGGQLPPFKGALTSPRPYGPKFTAAARARLRRCLPKTWSSKTES